MRTERQNTLSAIPSLKIAYLLPQFPVATQTFATSDIAALQAEGHDVRVYTMKTGGGAANIAGVPVSRTTLRGMMRWPHVLWRMRRPVLSLAWNILRELDVAPRTAIHALLCLPRSAEITADIMVRQPDVVHLFWARHPGLVLALLKACKFPGIRSAFAGAYDLVADDFLVDLSLRSAGVAFSHSEANRDYVESKVACGTCVQIVHRGIPLPEIDLQAERDSHLWITASALLPEKNVEAVLRAFVLARAEMPGLRLSVFGEGPDCARLERWCRVNDCAQSVSFKGHVSRDELQRHMAKADAFLLLSKKPSERLPNVIKEALWAGCSVISSNSIGIREILHDDRFGFVVDPDDEDAVNQAVRRIVQRDRSEDAARRAEARELIEERFCATKNMQKYASAWAELVQGSEEQSYPAATQSEGLNRGTGRSGQGLTNID